MYFIIRFVLMVILIIWAATFTASLAAAYTADQAMSLPVQQFFTGLAGIVGALLVGGVFFLMVLLNNRE